MQESKGKKVYGYLKPEVKRTIDRIFELLASNESIQKMYELWCEMEQQKHDVYSSAKITLPSLVDNPQFKSVKNMIIQTVLDTSDLMYELTDITIYQTEEQGESDDAMLANVVFSLFVSLSRCIEKDYTDSYTKIKSTVDRKLRRTIKKQKQALGINEDISQIY